MKRLTKVFVPQSRPVQLPCTLRGPNGERKKYVRSTARTLDIDVYDVVAERLIDAGRSYESVQASIRNHILGGWVIDNG